MGVPPERGSRLRRVARSRPLGLLTLFGAAAVVATAPAVASFRSAFVAAGAPGFGEAAAGDHLQTLYRFWLFGHQLGAGRAPWRDPYSFQPLVPDQTVLGGWPFGLPFWPLDAAFGPVIAWNVLQLAVITAAGLATYAWLRRLELPASAAVVGGLVFAIAPYRLTQSTGHLLGWIAVLVPVALWAYEESRAATTPRRANVWGAVCFAALVTVPLSGQVHLAIGVLPFCLAYALVRRKRCATAWMAAGVAAGVAAGIAIRLTVIAGSNAEDGRTLDQVEMFQSDWLDLVSRFRRDGIEQFAYVGWLTPILAAAGLVVLLRGRRWLAAVLGLAAVVPLLFAVGTSSPLYAPIWQHFPPLHFTRVPGRLVPIAELATAALVAFAIAWLLRRAPTSRRPLVAAVVGLLVLGDLLVLPFRATAADPANAAYAALRARPGRTIELPLFEPGIHYGSIYDYYQLETPRERPGGYSTLAPPAAYDFFWGLNRMNCGIVLPLDLDHLRALGVRSLAFHVGAYRQAGRASAWHAWRALQEAGLRAATRGGEVWLLPLAGQPGIPRQAPPVPEPDRGSPILCEGWRGYTMKERDAPLWLYTAEDVSLTLTAPGRTAASIRVDDRPARRFEVDRRVTIEVEIDGEGWHSLVLGVPQLFLDAKPPQGLTIATLHYVPG